MNKQILTLLSNKAEFYPHQIEQKFPLILDKIVRMWNLPDFDTYLNTLMLDHRDHARQGFPPDVASEILRLSVLHSAQFRSEVSHSWIDSSDVNID